MRLGANPQNLLVNGGFVVSQENGVGVGTTNGYYVADEWKAVQSGMSAFSCALGLSGGRYFGYLSNSGAETTIDPSAYRGLLHYIEGIRLMPLGWGTADAIPAVLNFKAQAEKAGTFSVTVQNQSRSLHVVCLRLRAASRRHHAGLERIYRRGTG